MNVRRVAGRRRDRQPGFDRGVQRVGDGGAHGGPHGLRLLQPRRQRRLVHGDVNVRSKRVHRVRERPQPGREHPPRGPRHVQQGDAGHAREHEVVGRHGHRHRHGQRQPRRDRGQQRGLALRVRAEAREQPVADRVHAVIEPRADLLAAHRSIVTSASARCDPTNSRVRARRPRLTVDAASIGTGSHLAVSLGSCSFPRHTRRSLDEGEGLGRRGGDAAAGIGDGVAGACGGRSWIRSNQYVVSGGDQSKLGELGYDVAEGGTANGRIVIGTPADADALRAKGYTVKAPYGAATKAQAAPPSPLADPTYGYDVFRPWCLKPAPCPGTCSGAVDSAGKPINLQTWYEAQRAAHPDIVKKVVYGKSRFGQDLVAYKVSLNAQTLVRRRQARRLVRDDPARARVDRGRGRPAPVRLRARARDRHGDGDPDADQEQRAVVRADRQRRRLRLHVPAQEHAPVAQEPGRQRRQRHHRRPRRRRPQPQLGLQVAL